MPDAALVERIRAVLSARPFHGEGHRKVWARLRFAGVRTSRHRVLRLMREHALLAPSRPGSPRGPRNHDDTIIPHALDTTWGADMTTTWTREGQGAVFIAVDHQNLPSLNITTPSIKPDHKPITEYHTCIPWHSLRIYLDWSKSPETLP